MTRQDLRTESYADILSRAMGFFNYRGRKIEKINNSEFVMAGIKFYSMKEIDNAIDVCIRALRKSIR